MKTTKIAIVLLLVIIVGLVINAIMLNRISDHLISTVREMSDEPSEATVAAHQLEKHWEKWEPFISVSVVHIETEAISDAVVKIVKYAETENKSEFIVSKALFEKAAEHIRFSGDVSFETIL